MATIVSPRPWEALLVEAAADTGLVRLVARCYNPADLPEADAVVAGSEVPWLTVDGIKRWRDSGITVIGVFPIGDRPAIEMFCRAEIDQLFGDLADPVVILRAVRDLVAAKRQRPPLTAWSVAQERGAGSGLIKSDDAASI